jgi:hypothetical protein
MEESKIFADVPLPGGPTWSQEQVSHVSSGLGLTCIRLDHFYLLSRSKFDAWINGEPHQAIQVRKGLISGAPCNRGFCLKVPFQR